MRVRWRTLLLFLARPTLFFYALPWLMVLLVAGTVAQREIGLYQAEKIYFSSLVFWLGPVPLPGAFLVLGVIAVSLTAKLLLKSPWRRGALGTLITHGSMLVLLGGGLLSALGREEGYLELSVGESGAALSDYHDRALAVMKNGALVLAVSEAALAGGASISHATMPFHIVPQSYCRNCTPLLRSAPGEAFYRGAAAAMILAPAPLLVQDEDNRAGVVFAVVGAGGEADGSYIAFDGLKQMPSINVGADRYDFIMRHAERDLPFRVKLLDFKKSNHPGTAIARSYAATVEISDGGAVWPVEISMNAPLRYRGYTLYQASFIDRDGKFSTVLTVVKNSGQIFPYIAVALLCGGMALQLGKKFTRRRAAVAS